MESPDFFFVEAARQSKAIALLRETARLASNDGLRQVVNDLVSGEEKHLKVLVELQQQIGAPSP
jgi:rubrerythrin